MPMMQLGDFQFEITAAAYQDLQRKSGWTWSAQQRFGRTAQLQYTGRENDEITLTGTVYPEFMNVGFAQVQRLRELGDRARPQLMVSGTGAVLGYWCLTSLNEGQPIHHRDGLPRKQTFNLTLVFYGNDLHNP